MSTIKAANFNGFYTRSPCNGATYTSTWKNWSILKRSANEYQLIFIPSVGPGYDEKKKQPKTGNTRRHRSNGHYFGVAWRSAISTQTQFINIYSYNDWISGTQIEESTPNSHFKDYNPGDPNKYLDMTKYWINQFIQNHTTPNYCSCNIVLNNTIC